MKLSVYSNHSFGLQSSRDGVLPNVDVYQPFYFPTSVDPSNVKSHGGSILNDSLDDRNIEGSSTSLESDAYFSASETHVNESDSCFTIKIEKHSQCVGSHQDTYYRVKESKGLEGKNCYGREGYCEASQPLNGTHVCHFPLMNVDEISQTVNHGNMRLKFENGGGNSQKDSVNIDFGAKSDDIASVKENFPVLSTSSSLFSFDSSHGSATIDAVTTCSCNPAHLPHTTGYRTSGSSCMWSCYHQHLSHFVCHNWSPPSLTSAVNCEPPHYSSLSCHSIYDASSLWFPRFVKVGFYLFNLLFFCYECSYG